MKKIGDTIPEIQGDTIRPEIWGHTPDLKSQIGVCPQIFGHVPKFSAVMLVILFLSGCESTYYDMVMDKPESGKGAKDEAWNRASDVSRLGGYR